jgi:hypothetical protein
MTENETRAGKPATRNDHRLFEIVIGVGVLVMSVVSIFIAINANHTQERILAASVWPSLLFGTSNISQEGSAQISLDLLNRGTGPARVRWAEVLYDGIPVHDSEALLAQCCGQSPASQDKLQLFASGIQHRVVGADEWVTLLRVPKPESATTAWESLNQERHQVQLRLCYCSVLDDCWLLDSDRDDPRPVRQCPAAPSVLWGG